MHTPPRARTHTLAYTQTCNIYCFPTTPMILKRASVLRYAYIACHAYLFPIIRMDQFSGPLFLKRSGSEFDQSTQHRG